MLGVAVGIASFTVLASVGEATKRETMRRFKRMLGTFEMVIVQPGAGSTRSAHNLSEVDPSLKLTDAAAIATEIPAVRQVAPMQFALDLDVKYRQKSASPSVLGISSNWVDFRHDDIALGTGFTSDDEASLARVAVIGSEVRKALFPDEDPIGKQLRIMDVPFEIRGVLAALGVGPGGASLDNLVLIPITTASKRLFNRDYVTGLMVQLRDPMYAKQAIADITALLRERHGIVPPGEDDFRISSPAAQMAQVRMMNATLTKVLNGVAAVATLIGGMVIMSLMLIAVSERHKEIGVRRAMGALRRDIMMQFLMEAIVISLLGGVLGALVGIGATAIVSALADLPRLILWAAIAAAAASSAGIGLVFGLQPAWRAANVDPVEALRS